MAITGQVGDFMGGVIGSLWALAGVFLYFSAIKMQNKELENQSKFRREDRILDSIKEFENTFFALLASQQRIKDELSADFFDAKFDDNHKLCEDKIHASGNNFFYEAYLVLKKYIPSVKGILSKLILSLIMSCRMLLKRKSENEF